MSRRITISHVQLDELNRPIGSEKQVSVLMAEAEFALFKQKKLDMGDLMNSAFQMFFALVQPTSIEEKAAEAGFTL